MLIKAAKSPPAVPLLHKHAVFVSRLRWGVGGSSEKAGLLHTRTHDTRLGRKRKHAHLYTHPQMHTPKSRLEQQRDEQQLDWMLFFYLQQIKNSLHEFI